MHIGSNVCLHTGKWYCMKNRLKTTLNRKNTMNIYYLHIQEHELIYAQKNVHITVGACSRKYSKNIGVLKSKLKHKI